MNLGSIKRRVLGAMGDLNNALITAQLVVDWANDAQYDIARKTECIEDDDEISVITGLDNYAVDHLQLIRITTAELNGFPLTPTTREHLSTLDPYRHVNESNENPRLFYVWGSELWLYPSPVEDNPLHLWYYRLPAPLELDADVPEIPLHMHEDIVTYCKARAKELNEEEDESRQLMSAYEMSLVGAKDEVNNPINDSYPAVRLLYGDE